MNPFRSLIVAASLAAACVATLSAQQGPAPAPAAAPDEAPPFKFSYGGDIRLREVHFDNIPIKADPPGVTRGGENHFQRYRTRLWGRVDTSDAQYGLYGRLANEFRTYATDTSTGDAVWNAIDEIIVDNLYVDGKDVMGAPIDLRIGRQDLIYGNGRVILEGTPKDGSRTIYIDAAKVTWKDVPNTTIDFLGIYTEPENELAIHRENRDITGMDGAYNDRTESGGGVYIKNKSVEKVPGEAYYLYKHASDWINSKKVDQPEKDVNTFGTRLMPRFSDKFDANVEGAYQFGERGSDDMDGYMLDAALYWHPPVAESWAPALGVGWYYLSGDDPDTAEDEGWDPLWARWPQYSELYIYAWDADGAGRWSNLSMPYVDLKLTPNKRVKIYTLLGYMDANENDGPGPGTERGVLFTFRTDVVLKDKVFTEKDQLFGHVLVELLEPGDYYNVGDTADFLRLELSYKF